MKNRCTNSRPLALLSALALWAVSGLASAGLTRDTSFDTDGIATTDFNGAQDIARSFAVQADGRFVVAGTSQQNPNGTGVINLFAVTRYNTDGTPDTSFDTDGQATYQPGGNVTTGGAELFGVAIQPDDQKIVLVGRFRATSSAPQQIVVVRLNPNGTLDNTFDSDGVAFPTPLGVTDGTAFGVVGQPGGGIVVVGDANAGVDGFVIRLTDTGALDSAFAASGIYRISNPSVSAPPGLLRFAAVAVNSLGQIITVGGTGSVQGALIVVRLESNGEPDVTFGSSGVAGVRPPATLINPAADPGLFIAAQDLQVLPDGSIFVAGSADVDVAAPPFFDRDPVVLKLTPAGVPDGSYGAAGYALIPESSTGGENDAALAIAVRANGEVIVGGQTMKPTQISPNGLATFVLTDAGFTPGLVVGLKPLPGGGIAGGGRSIGAQVQTPLDLAAFKLNATDLPNGEDNQPDPFSFVDQVNVPRAPTIPPGTINDGLVLSNTITISGLDVAAPISVVGGSYSIDGGPQVTTAGTISNGQTVRLRVRAAESADTTTTTTLTIGLVSDVWTTTTVPGDAVPDAFAFTPVTDVNPSSVVTSTPVQITGIDTPATVTVTGGTSAVVLSSVTTCTAATFDASAKTVPNLGKVCARHTATSAPNGNTNTVVTVGGVSATFTSTTNSNDVVADPFSFVDKTGVELRAQQTSDPVTITGINQTVAVTVSGGQYSIGCTATYTAAAGLINNGQTVCVRHTSADLGSATVSTTLNVNGVTDVFTSTTRVADQTPNPFSFAPVAAESLAVIVDSEAVTITGIDSPTPISVIAPPGTFNPPLNESYSIGCNGIFVTQPGFIENNQTVCVSLTTDDVDNSTRTVTLRVNTTDVVFSVTTGDTAPDGPTSIPSIVGVAIAETVVSAPLTVTGVTADTQIRVKPTDTGEISLDCTQPYRRGLQFIANNQTFCVRHVSARGFGLDQVTTVEIGNLTCNEIRNPTCPAISPRRELTFTSTTGETGPVPGGSSAMDWLTLSTLGGLAALRRRRKPGTDIGNGQVTCRDTS